jgi:putative membrane protein
MMHGFYGPGGGLWWMGAGSMLVHLIFWGIVIYLIIRFANKYFNKTHETKVKENSAMAILRERYARGEIDAEEFQKKKADLE